MYKIFIFLLIISCGTENHNNRRNVSSPEEHRYYQLEGTVAELQALLLSDFSNCSGTDVSDALVKRICEISQAATAELRVSMKSELQVLTNDIDSNLSYIKEDIAAHIDELTAIETTISAYGTRLDDLESQMTDITEGICLRTRTTDSALDGAEVTFAWDSSIRMNSAYCTYNVPTAEYTIQKAGWYKVEYKFILNMLGGKNTTSRGWITINNSKNTLSTTYGFLKNKTQGEFNAHTTTILVELAVNDTLKVQNDASKENNAFGGGGADYQIIANESYFKIKYMDDN